MSPRPPPRFQSTLPVRGATGRKAPKAIPDRFQSTLPVRGATIKAIGLAQICGISIHAPREGSDPLVWW